MDRSIGWLTWEACEDCIHWDRINGGCDAEAFEIENDGDLVNCLAKEQL